MNPMPDVIDTLVGIQPGSALDTLRARRPDARLHAQGTYNALFAPEFAGDVTIQERFALAAFTIGVQHQSDIADFYLSNLASAGAAPAFIAAVQAAIVAATAHGPTGTYPPGKLSAENTQPPAFQIPTTGLTPRLVAAFAHAHMLISHPRDSAPEMLQALFDAGWSSTDIVTLSQLVAFLSFQIRVIAGLRALKLELAA